MAFVCRTAVSVEVRLTFGLTVCRVAYHRLGQASMEYVVCPKSRLDFWRILLLNVLAVRLRMTRREA